MIRSNRRPRILVFYPGLIPSVEISVLIPLRYLQRNGAIDLRAGTVTDFEIAEELAWCDLVVFSRCCLLHELLVLCKVKQLGIPYIYDLDDNFFRLAADKESSQPWLQEKGIIETLIAFIAGAVVVKTGSEQLKNDMSRYNQHIVIHEYVFDFGLIANKKERNGVVIGYAGSIVHEKDLAQLLPALDRIARDYPQVRFAFYGAKPEKSEAFTRGLQSRSEFIPFQQDYATFVHDVSGRGWSIALAPLKDSMANRSKTDNKFREYSACGIAGVYSKMPVYERRIQDGVTGMLADDTTQGWYEKIAYLLDHPDEREKIARRARNKVRVENALESVARRWLEELILPNLQQIEGEERRRMKIQSFRFKCSVYGRALRTLPMQARFRFIMRWIWKKLATI